MHLDCSPHHIDKNMIRAAIQEVMKEPVAIQDSDNLISLGLDSLKIMRLANKWRKAGVSINFATLLESPTLADWATLLGSVKRAKRSEEGSSGSGKTLDSQAPFALTDVQYAYWIGRRESQSLGGVGCHAYLELDGKEIVPQRLEKAWQLVQQHHPMLRARFREDGMQEIMEKPFFGNFVVSDFSHLSKDDVEKELECIRNKRSHHCFEVELGEVAALELALLQGGATRIYFHIDLLVADVHSLHVLLHDLAEAYETGVLFEHTSEWSFNGYLARQQVQNAEQQAEDARYWADRIVELPDAPSLPMVSDPSTVRNHKFTRRACNISTEQWAGFKENAASYGLTPALALLTLYAEIVAHWSENSHFLLSLPLFDRQMEESNIEKQVADFTNLLALEVNCTEDAFFFERAKQIQQQFNKDVAHTAYSGVRVQRDLVRQREGRTLCAPVVFAYNADVPLVSKLCRETLGELGYMISQTPQVWLDLQTYETETGMLFAWDAVDELFPADLLDTMVSTFGEYIQLLSSDTSYWEASFAPEVEHGEPAHELALDIPQETLHGPVFQIAKSAPERVALVNPRSGDELSYGDLAEKALCVASDVLAAGVGKGEAVAICLPRGEEQIIATLGILAAGCVYVPVSPDMPLARRERIHARANVRVVVTSQDVANTVGWPEDSMLVVPQEGARALTLATPIYVEPDAPAYIIFTSGSTGEPKGVCLRHNAARATIDAVNALYDVDKDDRAICVSALDFDLSVYDIFGLLGCGGSLVLVDEVARRDAELWAKWLGQYNVTIWNSVPILLEMVLQFIDNEVQNHLRLVLLSGDRIAGSLPEVLWQTLPECQVVGLGGATEGAIWSNHICIPKPVPSEWSSIPYGRPLPGQAYRVVDSRGKDCPPWKQGELWIGGSGVADGYAGDIERTDERFVLYKDERWYRTGDRGCFWPDGTIEFLGREDLQVKVRGHRIELGEIETALRRSSLVAEAVVTVAGETGTSFLVAHVVPESFDGDEERYIEELTVHLQGLLSEYMVPPRWSVLESLPLTANGKVDRKALIVPSSRDIRKVKEASPLESVLAILWEDLLGKSIDRDDNFFTMGGDSLLATRLVARIRKELAPELPLDALFQSPTIAGLSQHPSFIFEQPVSGEFSRLESHPEQLFEPFPLTDVQYTYWIGRTGAYALGNVATHVFFEFDSKPLGLTRLKDAWHALVSRHEMLRAVFLPDATQLVLEYAPDPAFTITDLRANEADEVHNYLTSLRKTMEAQVLPESTGPLYDIQVVRHIVDGEERLRIFFDIDALIADAWSVFLLIDEWFLLYDDPKCILSQQDISFRDYVMAEQEKVQSKEYQKDQAYWLDRAKQLPFAPALPLQGLLDASVPPKFIRNHEVLSKDVWSRLKLKVKEAGLTASGLLIAAYAEVLAKWSRTPHFTLNITLFNRPPLHEQVDSIVGDFTSLLLLEVNFKEGETVLERARAIQAQLWRDMDHRQVSGVEVLREMTRLAGGRTVTMPVVFTGAAGLGGSGRDASSLGLLGNLVSGLAQTPQVWLDHQTYEQDGALVINWDAVEGLFPKGMLEDMFAAYIGHLSSLAADTATWDAPPKIGLPEHQAAVRKQVNDTAQSVSEAQLHELFARQALISPNAPAVITPDTTVSYGKLFIGADLLASELRKRSIGAEHVVAVAIEKCWEQIASVLGVLASGAAYLPLDPSLPAERLATILQDSGASIVLTQNGCQLNVDTPQFDVGVLLNGASWDVSLPPLSSWVTTLEDSDSLAYIIYTSGSTGHPKGVMTGHQGAVNTVLDMNSRFQVNGTDRVFGLSALTFDLSVYDIFGPLSVGGALVLPSPDGLRNPDHWLKMVKEYNVTVWNSVPALMQMLVSSMGYSGLQFPEQFRLALLSGDWIPLDLPDSICALGDVKSVSLGGATEASIWSIYHEIKGKLPEWSSVPYGRPLGNQTMHVFTDVLEEAPDWVTGNIHIGGIGLAKGYWKDVEKTSAAFIQHPRTGERFYRTGDMGRYHPSGDIEFLGREDGQVKVGGFRIELGEVEAALVSCIEVREAAAIVGANERLVGFVVPHPDVISEEAATAAHKRAAQLLPDYMVPPVVISVQSLPLTSNGKVDRKKLIQRAQQEEVAPEKYIAPRTQQEQLVARVWGEILEIERIDVNAHFFEAGGNSLLAVQVANRLRTFASNLSVVTLFEYPTVASLAHYIEASGQKEMGEAVGFESGAVQHDSRAARRRDRIREKHMTRRRQG